MWLSLHRRNKQPSQLRSRGAGDGLGGNGSGGGTGIGGVGVGGDGFSDIELPYRIAFTEAVCRKRDTHGHNRQ